jgi:translation elongation factor EF-1beta
MTAEEKKFSCCPLCLGIRDPINNLLEVGSTVQHIKHLGDGKVEVKAVQSEKEWFSSKTEQVICFGCKRLLMEIRNDKKCGPEAVKKLLELLPDVIKINAEIAF